jgi:hypothetical protein
VTDAIVAIGINHRRAVVELDLNRVGVLAGENTLGGELGRWNK